MSEAKNLQKLFDIFPRERVIGHRGAMGLKPENTLISFKQAIEFGVGAVELDIIRCKSGEVVVIHDETVDRTTNGKGAVADLTFEQLRKLDAGGGERVPTLEEVADVIDKRTRILIELKGPKTAEFASIFINNQIAKKGWAINDFLVSSFNHVELEAFKALNSEISTGILIWACPTKEELAVYAKMNAHSIHMAYNDDLINEAVVSDAHKFGMQVFAYTVNSLSIARKLKAMKVNAIFSDLKIQE